MSSIITLTTDIGWAYAAQMKASILSINPDAKIVDVTHDISPRNVMEGAYVLYSTVIHFPNAIHIAVVDPGVGTERKSLIVECDKGCLIGPDNGILIPAGRRLDIKTVYEITEKRYMSSEVSTTFHGRDIFSPIAAHISLGVSPHEMGKAFADYRSLDFGDASTDNVITGKIIFVDKFGNIITNIPKEIVGLKNGDSVKAGIASKEFEIKFVKSYGYAEKNDILLTISSSNFLEISCRDGNACKILGANIGEKIEIARVADF
ncbi:MAG: SAM-dependent chlorinase/fluorinase [Candidatus Thermoplasmatota archaeon]|nr:SAM-dependent chlorinase/fluorinase [Candidatus Thermoplasmatota archaeon]